MQSEILPQVNAKQNTATQVAAKQSKTRDIPIDSYVDEISGNMADKVTEVDYATMGASIAKTLTAANSLPEPEVKLIKGKIYTLFSGVDQNLVDFGVAAYFMLNDPSSKANWGAANPIVIGGKSVPASKIAGEIVSLAMGDGRLRKFLSAAYEGLANIVLKNTPGLPEQLVARAAAHGLNGVDPLVAVSWVRGTTAGTQSSGAARALFRARATSGHMNDVGPVGSVAGTLEASPAVGGRQVSSNEYF